MAAENVEIVVGARDDTRATFDALKRRVDEFKGKVAEAALKVNDDQAKLELDIMKGRLDEYGRKVETAKLKVNFSSANTVNNALSRMDQQITSIGKNADSTKGKLASLMSSLGSNKIVKGLGAAGGIGGGILAGGSSVLAMASPLAAAGLAIGAFGALAIPTLQKVSAAQTALTAAQNAYNQATTKAQRQSALKAEQKATMGLTDAQKGLLGPLRQVEATFTKMENAVVPSLKYILGFVNVIMQGLLPAVRVLAKTGGAALSAFLAPLDILIHSQFFATFIKQMGKLATQAAPVLGSALTGLLKVFMKLFIQTGPAGLKLLQALLPALIGLLNSLIPIIVPLANITAGFLAWLQQRHLLIPFLGAIAAGVLAVTIAMDANPVLAMASALLVLVAAVVWTAKHWKEVWAEIKHLAEDAWKWISDGWHKWLVLPLYALVIAIIYLKDHWKTIWDTIKRLALDFYNWIWHDFIQKLITFFTKTIPTAGDVLKESLRFIWDAMKIDVLKLVSAILGAFSHIPFIGHFFASARNDINKELGGIQRDSRNAWNNIQNDMNKLHGKSVDVTFKQVFRGQPNSLLHPKGKKAAGGGVGASGMYLVGEQGPELTFLPRGSHVVPAGATRRILGGLAGGTDGWNFHDMFKPGAGSWTQNLNSWFSKGESADITSILASGVLKKLFNWSGGYSGAGGLGGALPGFVGRWAPQARRALQMLGQPLNRLGIVLAQMTTESGGLPDVVNKWDSNWLAGHPSVGLMQVIRGTYDAYAGPFRNTGPFEYGVSVNPLANIFAGLNYAIHQYGVNGWTSVLGHGHGYDSGGWLMPGATLAINKTGRPERVIGPNEQLAVRLEVGAGGNSDFQRFMVGAIRKWVKVEGGGNVQAAFGSS